MTPIADKLTKLLDTFIQTTLSIVKITLFSDNSRSKVIKFENNKELIILANGPSLSEFINKSEDFIKGKTLLAVNFNVSSAYFESLKPELYVIADPFLWTDPTQMNKLFGELNQKANWDLHLFVPTQAFKVEKWQTIIKENKYIKIHKYNATPIEGNRSFCNFVFRKGWGVPRPHNVLIPALIVALNQSFDTIYLAGADHSWITEISVSDDNELLMNQKHFYDKNQTKAATVKKRDFSDARLHDTLYHLHIAFKSYFVIKDYAKQLNKQIYNITPGSFIDAFDRLKIY